MQTTCKHACVAKYERNVYSIIHTIIHAIRNVNTIQTCITKYVKNAYAVVHAIRRAIIHAIRHANNV